MRFSVRAGCRLTLCVCLLALAAAQTVWAHAPQPAQTPPAGQTAGQPKVPEAELAEARKVEAAADAAARLAAAGEFLKKYPKSTLRPTLAQMVSAKIGEVTDAAQQITLAEQFHTLFNEPTEAALIDQDLLEAYLRANRFADAFKLADASVDKMPDPVGAMIALVNAGYGQMQQRKTEFVPQTARYAARVIETIEADKRPASVDAAVWTEYRTKQLPQLYRIHGLLLYASGDAATAKTKLQKAIALDPNDMFAYLVLGGLRNEDYQVLANKYKAASGAQQADLLKQAQAVLDEVIDHYAHVIALSEGNAQYQQIHDQVLVDLQADYKYRHNNSLDGLQQLIDKYKPAATPRP